MKNILVIDDNVSILEEIADIFIMEGFNVITAEDGEEGIRIAKERIPDLIVSDIVMPNKNGFEVLSELINHPETSTIPFIFLSANAEKSDIREGMNLGADDYITKPISADDLILAVNNKFKKKEYYNKQMSFYKDQTLKLNKNISNLRNESENILENLKKAKEIQESIIKSSNNQMNQWNNVTLSNYFKEHHGFQPSCYSHGHTSFLCVLRNENNKYYSWIGG